MGGVSISLLCPGCGLGFLWLVVCWPLSVGSGLLLMVLSLVPSLPSWRGRLSFFSSVFPGFGGACPTGLGIWCLLFQVVAPFLVLGEVLSVFQVSWGLGAPCIVIGCCWAIALFGNKFLLIQKKKKQLSLKH